jgi:hypothetical protein
MNWKRTRNENARVHGTNGDDTNSRLSAAFGGSDRGQMLLVGAVVMGFMLVVLVLVLNSLLFAQNVESSGVQSDAPESADAREFIETELGVLMVAVNDEEGSSVESNFTSGAADTLSLWERQQFKFAGKSADVTVTSVDADSDDKRIRQTDGSEFRDKDNSSSDWTLATDVSDVRRFQFDVEAGDLDPLSLSSPNEGDTISSPEYATLAGTAFHVDVSTGGDDWRIYLYKDSSSEDLVVATESDVSTDRATIQYVGSDVDNMTLDVTTGSVDENQTGTVDRVGLFEFADDRSGPYDIEYKNPEEGEGNYTMTLNDATVDPDGELNTDGPPPYHTDAVYSAEVEFSYATNQLSSASTLTVAPCSTDQLQCEVYGVTDS